jgi:putative redox protein
MKINLKSTSEGLNFIGTNERGQEIQLSGDKAGVSPMESVLMAAAACSAIDIDIILRKMRQDFKGVEVDVEGQRAIEKTPAVFTGIHLHYKISGSKLKPEKVAQTVEMAVEKYCSVITMLMHSVNITYEHSIIET